MKRSYLYALLACLVFLTLSGFTHARNITGKIWIDANNNGKQDNGEVNLNIVVDILLYDGNPDLYNANPDEGIIGMATTGPEGTYSIPITGNSAGTFRYARFIIPTGYSLTSFQASGAGPDANSDFEIDPENAGYAKSITFNLNGNKDIILDAGLVSTNGGGGTETGSISGVVWLDTDLSGTKNESPVAFAPGIEVGLCKKVGSDFVLQGSAIETDVNGQYSFNGLQSGGEQYYVKFTLKTGYGFTQGSGDIDNSDNSDVGTDGMVGPININSNHLQHLYIDAGVYEMASLSGKILNDLDNSTIINPVVYLYECGKNSNPLTPLVNNNNFSFTDIKPGSYYLKFETPDGFILTNLPYGQGDNPGETACFDIKSGDDLEADAGATRPLGTVSGYVWDDKDKDGLRETDEPGLKNLDVILQIPGMTDLKTQTGSNGLYTFENVPAGANYKVKFNLEKDYQFSPMDFGDDDNIDSDAGLSDGTTAEFTLAANASIALDAGMFAPPAGPNPQINGILFHDTDGDGTQKGIDTDPGLGGWTVQLLNSTSLEVVAAALTNNDQSNGTIGRYEFTNVPVGTYYVKFLNPGGFIFTLQDAANNDNTDSDVDPNTGISGLITIDKNTNEVHIDAGVYGEQENGKGKISGILWLDADKDGSQGGTNTEPGIGGWTVELLNSGKSVVASTTSNSDGGLGTVGSYQFTSLPPGTYYVRFVNPGGYIFTLKDAANNDNTDSDADHSTGITDAVALASNASQEHVDAGVYPEEVVPLTGSIGDYVWMDLNGNGELNAQEPGVSGVKIDLYWEKTPSNFVLLESATTDAGGNYLFSGLIAGTYKVHFNPPADYKFTKQNGPLNSADNSDADPDPGDGYGNTVPFKLDPNDPSLDNILYADAGLLPSEGGKIGDFVWYDSDKNGIQDHDEPGVPGVTVMLYTTDEDNTSMAQTVTDSHGKYLFPNLNPGNYRIRFILPGNFDAFTKTWAANNHALDSDANPLTGFTEIVTLLALSDRLDIDAGLIRKPAEKANIGDFVWKDSDADGIQDKNEQGIPNVMVELYKWRGDTPIMTFITDSKGYYLFKNLEPGDYYVKFVLPEGFTFTKKDQPDNDALDSDADRQTGKTDRITLDGRDDLSIDAGLYGNDCMPVSLGDFVWNDLNKNGIQNSGEPGLSHITVNLFKAGKTTVHRTALTDKYGSYHFAGLLPGTYSVQFVLPKEFSFTLLNQGSNDALDSDADMASGLTAPFNLSSGEANNTIDAGMFEGMCILANLGDFVWNDCNRNGIQDVGETGIGGVELKLHLCAGDHSNPNAQCTCGSIVASAKTDKNGKYMFTNIMPGYYCIEIVVPCSFTISKPDQAEDFKDSDVIPAVKHTACIKLNTGETNLTVDAGLYPTPPAVIGDLVWIDANKNGIQDNGEKGLCNVNVELYMCGISKPVAAAKTDNDGKYTFKNVIPNTSYSLKFYLPKGYSFASLDQGCNDSFDSDVCPKNNGMTKFYDILPDETNLTIDCGMYLSTATACNYVWKDNNNNGLKDEGEAGIQGVTVELYQCSNNALIQSAKTDAAGLFTFNDILLESYYMKILVPDGYKMGKTAQEGAPEGVNTDFGTNGQSACFDVADGTTSIGRPVALILSTTGVTRGAAIPTEFSLRQNYPNPFNPSTTIEFAVPAAGQYTLKVFNMLGQEVATLLSRELPVGYHMAVFDASGLTSGMYIYRLSGNDVVLIKKMMLSK